MRIRLKKLDPQSVKRRLKNPLWMQIMILGILLIYLGVSFTGYLGIKRLWALWNIETAEGQIEDAYYLRRGRGQKGSSSCILTINGSRYNIRQSPPLPVEEIFDELYIGEWVHIRYFHQSGENNILELQHADGELINYDYTYNRLHNNAVQMIIGGPIILLMGCIVLARGLGIIRIRRKRKRKRKEN